MNLLQEKEVADIAYYKQIDKAVKNKIPQEELQDIINDYTQLQQQLQKRETTLKDIETLADLVAALKSEVKKVRWTRLKKQFCSQN